MYWLNKIKVYFLLMPRPRVDQLSKAGMQTLRDPGFFHLLPQSCIQQMKEESMED